MAYRILLVEDDEDFREPLAILLSQDGYNVQAAVNGQEALEGLAGQSYDIIVSDLRMPGIDGEQLFRCIEREWPHLASRVVIMTAERPTRGFLGQHDGALVPILHKLFTSAHLQEVIASVIARDGREARVESVADGFDSLPDPPSSAGDPENEKPGRFQTQIRGASVPVLTKPYTPERPRKCSPRSPVIPSPDASARAGPVFIVASVRHANGPDRPSCPFHDSKTDGIIREPACLGQCSSK